MNKTRIDLNANNRSVSAAGGGGRPAGALPAAGRPVVGRAQDTISPDFL